MIQPTLLIGSLFSLLVFWSIFIWFGSALAASFAGLSQQDGWQIVSRPSGLMAALTIPLAYVLARWIKQRYGISSISEEAGR
jgi:hypothetical protein